VDFGDGKEMIEEWELDRDEELWCYGSDEKDCEGCPYEKDCPKDWEYCRFNLGDDFNIIEK